MTAEQGPEAQRLAVEWNPRRIKNREKEKE